MTRIRLPTSGISRVAVLGAIALAVALSGAAIPLQAASAQEARDFHVQLPPTIHAEPSTARVFTRDSCDGAYPMDEWQSCGTETGGPVGGRN